MFDIGASGYGSKPRPALIVQSDKLSVTKSVITCGITSVDVDEVPFRTFIDATTENGLYVASAVMIKKLLAIPRGKSGKRIGELSREDMTRVEHAMLLVLRFAG